MIQQSNSEVVVNLSALKSNVSCLSCYLDEGTRIMAVVKANAYGHGAVQVAKSLQPLVESFAVNDIGEGIELREHGITKPVLVFGVPEESFANQYRLHNLTATISSEDHFQTLPHGTSYHLNFDTGMGRMGFRLDEAEQVRTLVDDNRELFCTGLYTHFATAGEPGSDMVEHQHRQFEKIRKLFPEKLDAHLSQTGGTIFYETKQFNMVRLGIGLYGYPPGLTEIEGLTPILSWKSKLMDVRSIKKETPVSYGANWKAPSDGYLGVIPIGYANGLKRNLSGKVSVRIGSDIFEAVGTITMNYTMVFLKDKHLQKGTEVELLYSGSDAGSWAEILDTIPYEILTSIDEKIPRVYI